ncbi:hypothetical protein [Nocardioides nanhaiensis]|uniref:Chemotaxis methyl-accepting receptor HlyB-like 4HB MCP domain-containing protein n=1 Tax=Nocardioides nanhaiensis TaxID=1476871 RepID=A0ABP8W5F1_9ACTN
MTQAPGAASAPARPAPAGAPPAPAVAAAPGLDTAQAQRLGEDVPQLLNRLQVAAVALCVVFGVLAGLVQLLAWQGSGRAADNTEQLVRVQAIETSLYRADALATNAYLSGGLEPAEQRAAYDDAIEQVLADLTAAAEAQPADREALTALAGEVNRYTTAITQARDGNRQGYPVGKAYLAEAGTALRGEAAAVLDALVEANTERSEEELQAHHPVWLIVLAVLVVLGLWFVNRQIAQRFHRRVNLGIAVAAGVVLLATLVAAAYGSARNGTAEELQAGAFRTAVDEAEARTAANDAKAQESKRLINRAAGETAEEPWLAASAIVRDNTTRLAEWRYYVGVHGLVVKADDEGRYDDAVQQATGGSTTAFDQYDELAAAEVEQASGEVTAELRSRGFSLVLVVFLLLAGLVASGAVAWGINQRRREYA